MPTWITSLPFAAALGALFVIGLGRGQATYWIARLAVQGTASVTAGSHPGRRRLAAWLTGPRIQQGRVLLGRWGLPLVSPCYLTVGMQTIVLAASGVLRIGWPRFTLAQVPGSAAGALIYATIGFAAWEAAIGAAASSPLGLAIGATVAVMVVASIAVSRAGRSRRRRALEAEEG